MISKPRSHAYNTEDDHLKPESTVSNLSSWFQIVKVKNIEKWQYKNAYNQDSVKSQSLIISVKLIIQCTKSWLALLDFNTRIFTKNYLHYHILILHLSCILGVIGSVSYVFKNHTIVCLFLFAARITAAMNWVSTFDIFTFLHFIFNVYILRFARSPHSFKNPHKKSPQNQPFINNFYLIL